MTTTVTRINEDGTVKTTTTDTRTVSEKLNGKLSWGERLEIMYPTKTTEEEITKGWAEYDSHKFYK